MTRIAIQSSRYAKMVALPDGMNVAPQAAIDAGYVIARDAAHAKQIREAAGLATAEHGSSYLDAVMALSEAKDRPAAAAKVAAAYSMKTMPLAKVAMFLSGLPVEIEDVKPQAAIEMTPQLEARIRRKCELHLMGLQRRSTQGEVGLKPEIIALRYALDLHRGSRLPLLDALKSCGVDFTRLRAAFSKMGD